MSHLFDPAGGEPVVATYLNSYGANETTTSRDLKTWMNGDQTFNETLQENQVYLGADSTSVPDDWSSIGAPADVPSGSVTTSSTAQNAETSLSSSVESIEANGVFSTSGRTNLQMVTGYFTYQNEVTFKAGTYLEIIVRLGTYDSVDGDTNDSRFNYGSGTGSYEGSLDGRLDDGDMVNITFDYSRGKYLGQLYTEVLITDIHIVGGNTFAITLYNNSASTDFDNYGFFFRLSGIKLGYLPGNFTN